MNTTAAVDIAGVAFSYGDAPVLEGVDLRVAQGEFLGLVGPNAGGKSTLLKLILGLLEPQAGTVLVLGRPPAQARRLLGYVPQYPGFPRDFPITVEQVVLMGRLGLGTGWRRLARRLYGGGPGGGAGGPGGGPGRETLAGRQIGTLSGGQLQRVLVARALVGEPRLLILDEPTANIDQRMEGEIFDLLRAINARMTILVVSHDVAFISAYVGRVACLNRTLVCHPTQAIDGQIIHDLYGEDVRQVAHAHPA